MQSQAGSDGGHPVNPHRRPPGSSSDAPEQLSGRPAATDRHAAAGPRRVVAGSRVCWGASPGFQTRHLAPHWHLTGFIVPSGEIPRAEVLADSSEEIVEEVTGESPPSEESADEGKTARKGHFPASIGLSFRIHTETHQLDVRITWGDYDRIRVDGQRVRMRDPRGATLPIPIPDDVDAGDIDIPDSYGLETRYFIRSVSGDDGARDGTVSMFLRTGGLQRLQAPPNFVTGPMRSSRRWR